MTKKKSKFWKNFGIAIFIISIVALFLVSIGKIDLFEKQSKPLKKLHPPSKEPDVKILEIKKAEKEVLKKKLDRKSNRLYKTVKYLLAFLYAALNVLGWFLLWNGDVSETIGSLVSYNEAAFIVYLFFMLVFPKKPYGLASLSTVLKKKIRKSFYRKYPELEEEIKQLEIDISIHYEENKN
jgi:hypothetical protein